MVQDRAIVTTTDQHKIVYDPSIGIILNDLEQLLTWISRSRQYSRLNISIAVEDRHIYNGKRIAIYGIMSLSMTFNDP